VIDHVSSPLDDDARRAALAFDAAADTYDHEALGFWNRVGSTTVARLALAPGHTVLDVPAGSGASALPAARAVGPTGRVVAADISAGLLGLASRKAEAEGLHNLELRHGDMRTLGLASESFDAVICVFGVFFVSDRVAMMRELWRMVKPGGRLAITTWGPDVLEPGGSAFWDAVREVAPERVRGFSPWDDLVEPDAVVGLFTDAGIESASAELEPADQPLRNADDWWAIVLGTGFRGTLDALGPRERERVKAVTLERMRDVPSVRASAIYAVAEKER
jgi:ubiquinone/menaquinone biosynthesis C-methylase UbiE